MLACGAFPSAKLSMNINVLQRHVICNAVRCHLFFPKPLACLIACLLEFIAAPVAFNVASQRFSLPLLLSEVDTTEITTVMETSQFPSPSLPATSKGLENKQFTFHQRFERRRVSIPSFPSLKRDIHNYTVTSQVWASPIDYPSFLSMDTYIHRVDDALAVRPSSEAQSDRTPRDKPTYLGT